MIGETARPEPHSNCGVLYFDTGSSRCISDVEMFCGLVLLVGTNWLVRTLQTGEPLSKGQAHILALDEVRGELSGGAVANQRITVQRQTRPLIAWTSKRIPIPAKPT